MRIALAVFLGGLVMHVCGFISHEVIAWPKAATHKFSNEAEVSRVIKANAPETGIYWIPHVEPNSSKKEQEEVLAKLESGPFIFASIRPGPKPFSIGKLLGTQFLFDLLAAALITGLILLSGNPCFGCRVGMATLVGVTAAVMHWLPYHHWYDFSWHWTLGSMADTVARCVLAGTVIAGLLNKKKEAATTPAS